MGPAENHNVPKVRKNVGKGSVITPEMKAMVGRETVRVAAHEVGKATIMRFAAAIGDENPLYWDDAYSKKYGFSGLIAPPTLLFETSHNIWGEVSEDGGCWEDILMPPPGIQIIRGGNEYEILKPVQPEDVITGKRKITDIHEKEGKNGTLCFFIFL